MSWQFRLSFDDGSTWTDITSLVRDDSVKLTRTLHNDDFEPVQDSLKFAVNLDVGLATTLLGEDPETIILIDVERDGSDYFVGYVRPITEYTVTDETIDQVNEIGFEALDNSYRLERTLSSDLEYNNYTIMDPSSTSTSIVHALLVDAGYSASEINISDTISQTQIAETYSAGEKTYREILIQILKDWGYVYYFDESGRFNVYRWRGDDVPDTPSYAVGPANIIGELKVDAEELEAEQYRVSYWDVRTDNTAVFRDDGANADKEFSGDKNKDFPGDAFVRHDFSLEGGAIPDDGEPLKTENFKVTYNTRPIQNVNRYSIVWSTTVTYDPATSTYSLSSFGDAVRNMLVKTFNAVSIRQADLQFTIDTNNSFDLNHYSIRADLTWRKRSGVVEWPESGSFDRVVEVDAKNVGSESEARNLAVSLKNDNLYGRYKYAFTSETDIPLGGYVTVSSTVLNFSTTARITKRTYARSNQPKDQGADIVAYEARGVAGLDPQTGVVSPVSPSYAITDTSVVQVTDITDDNGNLTIPMVGANIEEFDPGAAPDGGTSAMASLFFTSQFLGFWDGSEWTAYIKNDGTFKFQGDASNYIEWDGAKLNIEGSLFLSGDSELRGTVTTGDGVQSSNYVAGTTGWQIDGDGNAEFRSGNIGGWILDELLKSAASGRRIELDPDNNRVAIFDDTEAKVVQGYLGGLPKNDGLGTWGATDYGFWARQGARLRIDGTVEQVNGDWILDKDSAFLLSQVAPDDTPFDGARRLRFGANEIAVDEYAGGSWVNRVTIDASSGVETHTVRGSNAILLYAGPFKDVVDAGYSVGRAVPAGGEAYRFEQSYTDLVAGDDEWTEKQNLSFTTDCRYGEHAITGDGTGGAKLERAPWSDLELNAGWDLEWWFKIASIATSDYTPMFSAMAGEQGMRLGLLELTSEYATDSYATGYWETTPTNYSGQMQLSVWYPGRWEYLMLSAATGVWRYIGLIPDGGNVRVVFDNADMALGPVISGSYPWDTPAVPAVTWHMEPSHGQIVDMLYVNTQSASTVSDILARAADEVGFGSIDNDRKMVFYAENGLIFGAPVVDGLTVESGGGDIRGDVLTQRPALTSGAVLNAAGATSGDAFATLDPYVPTVGDTVLVRGGTAFEPGSYSVAHEAWYFAVRESSTTVDIYGVESSQESSPGVGPVYANAGNIRTVTKDDTTTIGDVFMTIG